MRDLDLFLPWLKENHPDIHEKYARNYTISSSNPNHVGVTNSYRISDEVYQNLLKIAQEWYALQEA